MGKKWLIDAHNVMHQIPEIARSLRLNPLSAYTQFCRLVQQQCGLKQMRARAVFDGNPLILPEKFHLVEIFYSRERTADEVIIQILRKEGAAQKWAVITDDREIRQKAYYHHVDIIRTSEFTSLPFSSARPDIKNSTPTSPINPTDPGKLVNPKVDEEEVNELLNLFNQAKKNRD